MLYATLICLAGCAQQKQQMPQTAQTAQTAQMPFDNYERFAKVQTLTDACLKSNLITAQEAGQSNANISMFLSSWAYNSNHYSSRLEEWRKEVEKIKVTQEVCNSLRAKIYQDTIEAQRYQKQVEMHLQQQAEQRALRSIQNMQNTLPKTTYCNSIGTQTICNSY